MAAPNWQSETRVQRTEPSWVGSALKRPPSDASWSTSWCLEATNGAGNETGWRMISGCAVAKRGTVIWARLSGVAKSRDFAEVGRMSLAGGLTRVALSIPAAFSRPASRLQSLADHGGGPQRSTSFGSRAMSTGRSCTGTSASRLATQRRWDWSKPSKTPRSWRPMGIKEIGATQRIRSSAALQPKRPLPIRKDSCLLRRLYGF